MPIPTVKCMLCNQEVTKRSTLSLEPLGLGDGRACRSHDQVAKALTAKIEQEKLRNSISLASASLRILSGVASVKVMHSFFGWPVELIYLRLSARLSKKEIEKIREEIEKSGGPSMTYTELMDTVIAAADLVHN